MTRDFPHLADTQFPNVDNVNVYKYRNEFDYGRYDYSQMDIIVCNVPWDVGEARVGNRTISGIGNVVYFDSKEARDKWFDDIPDDKCFRFSTKLKQLHSSNTIDLPLPFDIASKFNYVVVRYSLFANDSSPVFYEDETGLKEWFWFIREVEFLAPNNTRVHLLNDAWQTFIYDLDVTGMVLERGHAPMKQITADTYLQSPVTRCRNLLAPDVVSDNAAYIAVSESGIVFNAGDMQAVIISTASPRMGYGTKAGDTWHTPSGHYSTQGAPSYYATACDAGDFNTLLTNIDAQAPQFMQTVKAVFFISTDVVYFGSEFTFCDVTCRGVGSRYVANTLTTLDKEQFNYPDQYANIAKLYTYPYSYIELTDANGNIDEIRIETTNGKIVLETCMNLIYPFLKINGHVTSVGRSARRSVVFTNIDSRTMPIQGNWYEYLMSWDVPTYGVIQQASIRNDYNTHFDRKQQRIAYENAYNSSVASANTAQTNSVASSNTAQSNENANAATITANAALQTGANDSTTAENKTFITNMRFNSYAYNNSNTSAANSYISATCNSEIEATEQQAAVSATAGAITSAAGAAGTAAGGNAVGAIGDVIGGVAGVASTLASANISANLTAAQAAAGIAQNNAVNNAVGDKLSSDVNDQQSNLQELNDIQNDLIEASAANNAATINANASRSNATETANAGRTNTTDVANAGRSRNTAQNAITNQIAQAALNAPEEYGAFGYGDSATTRPIGAFANIVTLDNYSVHSVGDEFLRYGYRLNRQWDFDGDWNVCQKFTYWKLSDFWVSGLSIADAYVDKLRFFLFGGVTVWRKPEYIGKTSIYDNGL